jgi:Fanconi anemia group M protein
MGIPQVDMMELTGNVGIPLRERAYAQKRVLFMTPQVIANDLSRGLVPAHQLKLIVVDEAHRAQGDYAYCTVIRELNKSAETSQFRVLALSATPGTDLQAVKLMLQNLHISHIELRNEDSPDIVPYTFQRKIEKIVVPLSTELLAFKNKVLSVLEHFVRRLTKIGALSRRSNSTNPQHYSKFGLITARDEFRRNPPARLDRSTLGMAEGDFASAISLYHAYELLIQHGMRSFYNFMDKTLEDAKGPSRRLRSELQRLPVWNEVMSEMREKFVGDADHSRLNASGPRVLTQIPSQLNSSRQGEEIVLGHPKLEKLKELVVDHFRTKQREEPDSATRVMIFSQYRDSVQEITACLDAFKPLIKVMEFVGQAGKKGKVRIKLESSN